MDRKAAKRLTSTGALVSCHGNRIAVFRSAKAPHSSNDAEAMPIIARRSDAEDGAVPPEPLGADGGSREEQKGACLLKRKGSLEPSLSLWNLHRRW